MLLKVARAAFRVLPRTVQRRVRDQLDALRRRAPPPHRGLPELGLTAAQVYPRGVHFDRSLRDGTGGLLLKDFVIGRETPLASIGSCFADELAAHLLETGLDYVRVEGGVFPASANWGRVYTIPCLHQIVRYSSGAFATPIERSRHGWFDPLREPAVGYFPTREAAEAAIRAHRAASRRALTEARVLVITLGQNEAWVDRESSLTWAHRPPTALLEANAGRFEARTFSFEDDVRWLEDTLTRLRDLNGGLDVLLTVSPVASYATFAGEEAVTQSFAGKCVLRAVVERITRTVPRVWYFPAFEMALAYNPHTLCADNRHVKNFTVDRILRLLDETAVRR